MAKNYAANLQPEIALENYKKVLNENPNRILTAVDYGELLVKTGKLKAADSLFKVLSKKYPRNASFKYQQGLIKKKLKDSTAMHYFTYTIMLDTTHQAALYKVAKDNLRNRQYTMAEHYSKRGLRANPNNPSLLSILAQTYAEYLSLGLTYKMQEKHKDALDYFNKSLEENPDNERALYERAVAADNYMVDDETVIGYYQAYFNKYESIGNDGMLYRAKIRISDLKKKIHLAGN